VTEPQSMVAAARPAETTLPSAELRKEGFVRYQAMALGEHEDRIIDFHEIAAAFTDLPVDPYAKDGCRFRRYSQLVYLPWLDALTWVPDTPDPVHGQAAEYWQGGFNPEFPGSRRRFPAVRAALKNNSLLTRLIRSNIAQVLWHDDLCRAPVYVGVHLIKLSVDGPGKVAVSSPNCLHQDGGETMFTFAHLVTCDNVVGGENVIAASECTGRQPDEVASGDIRARFRLSGALDSYAVHDHRVSHYVSPVRLGPESNSGSRSVIIMGIAPLAPRL
jgi:hypothetical protein